MSDLAVATTQTSGEAPATGYYGVPVIQRPPWKWLVIGYFFFGGISGGSAAIGGVARLCGGDSGHRLARVATYVSLAALAPCPPLLILDLGRPRRFFKMLQAVRPTSPMSIGTWGMTAFGTVSALTAAVQIARDLEVLPGEEFPGGRRAGRALAMLSTGLGLFAAGYTGILLVATAVPLWCKRPGLLGPLFLASAISSSSAAISAALALVAPGDDDTNHGLERLETTASVAEGALLAAWIATLGPTARPLSEGDLGTVTRLGVAGAGLAAPLMIAGLRPRLPRGLRRPAGLLASALTLAGVFALRYAVVEGGRRSADDPGATFAMTG
jgi:formate-dependent nitrite reductase membrane component NrfD